MGGSRGTRYLADGFGRAVCLGVVANRYWTYYLGWIALTYVMREPRLLIGIAGLLVLRRVLPDPGALLRLFRRGRALRDQVEVNPRNVTASRDLAILYLDVLRPARALALLETALERCPNDADLLYLAGLSLSRTGRHEPALSRLEAAVEADPRVRFGLPYLVAGDALLALRRYPEAADAYERYTGHNGSDLRGYLGVARAHHGAGEHREAAAAVAEALRTWRILPRHMRRKMFRQMLRAQWARVWMLREPSAIAGAAALTLLCLWLASLAAPAVASVGHWWGT